MAQKVKVQDGNITYAAADPAHSVNIGVHGQLNVTKELNVGDDPFADGTITAPPNVDLIISTDGTGNLRFEPGAAILLNNVSWPDGTVAPVPGMFLGVTSLNTLQFTSFILGIVPSDTETNFALNALFPTALPGQFAVGPTTIYQSLGSGNWRKLGSGAGGAGTVTSVTVNGTSGRVTSSGSPITSSGSITLDLDTTAVTPGSYTASDITVDAYGRITAAANGSVSTGLMRIVTSAVDYTLQLLDAVNTLIRITKATSAVVTIPHDTTLNMPIGSAVLISWNGVGAVSIAGEAGVIVDTPDTYNIARQYGKITAIKVDANHWEIEGNLEPL